MAATSRKIEVFLATRCLGSDDVWTTREVSASWSVSLVSPDGLSLGRALREGIDEAVGCSDKPKKLELSYTVLKWDDVGVLVSNISNDVVVCGDCVLWHGSISSLCESLMREVNAVSRW